MYVFVWSATLVSPSHAVSPSAATAQILKVFRKLGLLENEMNAVREEAASLRKLTAQLREENDIQVRLNGPIEEKVTAAEKELKKRQDARNDILEQLEQAKVRVVEKSALVSAAEVCTHTNTPTHTHSLSFSHTHTHTHTYTRTLSLSFRTHTRDCTQHTHVGSHVLEFGLRLVCLLAHDCYMQESLATLTKQLEKVSSLKSNAESELKEEKERLQEQLREQLEQREKESDDFAKMFQEARALCRKLGNEVVNVESDIQRKERRLAAASRASATGGGTLRPQRTTTRSRTGSFSRDTTLFVPPTKPRNKRLDLK
jgi:DNA repair exonuclease SbcCD ATPase subunit